MRWRKIKKHTIGNKRIKLSAFIEDMIVYVENCKAFSKMAKINKQANKKTLELRSSISDQYRKITKYEANKKSTTFLCINNEDRKLKFEIQNTTYASIGK